MCYLDNVIFFALQILAFWTMIVQTQNKIDRNAFIPNYLLYMPEEWDLLLPVQFDQFLNFFFYQFFSWFCVIYNASWIFSFSLFTMFLVASFPLCQNRAIEHRPSMLLPCDACVFKLDKPRCFLEVLFLGCCWILRWLLHSWLKVPPRFQAWEMLPHVPLGTHTHKHV